NALTNPSPSRRTRASPWKSDRLGEATNGRRRHMKSKRRETIYLPADVAEALRRASLAAGGYGEKTRIAAESIRAHPEVRAQLEKIREERIMTMARMRW